MECLLLTLDVLLNLSKYAPARRVMTQQFMVRALVEQASRFKDASAEAFSRACAVLWSLAHEKESKEVRFKFVLCPLQPFLKYFCFSFCSARTARS